MFLPTHRMQTIRECVTEEAAKPMVHALVTSNWTTASDCSMVSVISYSTSCGTCRNPIPG